MGSQSIFPEPAQEFIRANYKGISYRELAGKVNAAFGTSYTRDQLRNYCIPRGLNNGLDVRQYHFPKPIREFIVANHRDFGYSAMADQVNSIFGTSYPKEKIANFYHSNKLYVDGAIRSFEKGNLPASTKPLGYERISRGYVEVKVRMRPSIPEGHDNFELKHHLVWEQAHGPIPKDGMIIFLDGDRTNCDLENLQLITKAENGTMLRRHLNYRDPSLRKSGALIAKVIVATNEKKKKHSGKTAERN